VNCLCPIALFYDDVGPGPQDRSCLLLQLEIVMSMSEVLASVFSRTTQDFWPVQDRPTHNPEFVDSISPRTRSQ
jgi:hypothetical protein